MQTCETVKVSDGNGSYFVINKSDFDSKEHELFEPAEEGGSGNVELTVAELKAALDEAGIDYGKTAKKADLLALLAAKQPE